jgi:hypothetical protein
MTNPIARAYVELLGVDDKCLQLSTSGLRDQFARVPDVGCVVTELPEAPVPAILTLRSLRCCHGSQKLNSHVTVP